MSGQGRGRGGAVPDGAGVGVEEAGGWGGMMAVMMIMMMMKRSSRK